MKNAEEIKVVTYAGMVVNVFLTFLKFVLGTLGGSQAVIADALHSLSDLSTDFAVLVGVRYWTAPADQEHHYGHHRVEAIITFCIGLALFLVALKIGYHAIVTIPEVHSGKVAWVALLGPFFSVILKEIIYRWTYAVGKKTKSSAVMANAWHHRSDVLSSIPATVAVVVSIIWPEWSMVDHIGAVIVSVFIIKVAWDIIWPSIEELTDKGGTVKDHDLIRETACQVKGVKGVKKIRTRKVGEFLFCDLEVLVDQNIPVWRGHAISENVKKALLAKGSKLLDVVIHTEPY